MKWIFLSGSLLGWGLGANDAANVFGAAVYTKIIKYRTAIICAAVFTILGALIDGNRGIVNLGNYAFESGVKTPLEAFYVMLAAGLTVLLMTVLKLPISTSQAVIGAIIGCGATHGSYEGFAKGGQFLSAWIVTPLGALAIAYILYALVQRFLTDLLNRFHFYEFIIRGGYLMAGIMGAYALGANNVANVTAIFTGKVGVLSIETAQLIGGISIAMGILTFSKPVMSTVGEGITDLSPIAGLIAVISAAITVYIYARIGIPVSTSQAVVGAIIGIGIKNGMQTIRLKVVRNIAIGWVGTPAIAGVVSYVILKLFARV